MNGYVRGMVLVAVYLGGAVTAASVLAWLLDGMLDYAYAKIMSRSLLLFAAIGLIPMWRAANLNTATIGLRPFNLRHLLLSYPVGIVLVLPLMLVFMVTGYRVVDDRVVYLSVEFLQLCAVALLSGVLVGIFEETLFRGVFFSALRRSSSFVWAATFVSLLYAGVHFLRSEGGGVLDPAWYSGYTLVLQAFAGFSEPGQWWDSFIALFLLGVLFCWIREHLTLWWCIGLHAAWVFAIRLFKELTVRDVANPYDVLVGSYDNFVGILVALWLIFLFVLIALYRSVVVSGVSKAT